MEKTLNVNVGSVAFIIDEDAYRMLKKYLEDVESRFEFGERRETMNDVEMRIADIFTENLASSRHVVDIDLVRRAISIIGGAEEFGERKDASNRQQADFKKLRRSVTDRVIGGVCGGLAKYFALDPALVRVIMFLLIFFGGLSLWVYIILWIIIPPEIEISAR